MSPEKFEEFIKSRDWTYDNRLKIESIFNHTISVSSGDNLCMYYTEDFKKVCTIDCWSHSFDSLTSYTVSVYIKKFNIPNNKIEQFIFELL